MQRFASRPFVLLGVNGDESLDEMRHTERQSGLTWASWWDGPAGPIATACKVDRFPTLVLIDHRGMVRHRYVGMPGEGVLQGAIETLLAEAEGRGKGK